MTAVGIRQIATHNDPGPAQPGMGSPSVTDAWDEEREERPRRRRRRRREQREEERAYRAARRRAHLKFSFLTHALVYGVVCLFVLFVAGFRPFFYVALSWAAILVLHYFIALVAPGLRRTLIESEVSREVEANVTRERRTLEDKHARSLEQLSASIAHEIRNPITAAKSLVQQMGEDPRSEDSVSYAKVALDELDRVERSISHLLRFARDEEMDIADLRLPEVVDSALETFRDRFARSAVSISRDIDGDGRMRGDPEKLRRVLINLVGNALDALEGAGTPDARIEVAGGENLAGNEVWLRVRDNGPGMDPEALGKIFSPFYTSKETGTGLGLAISKKVIDAHGGAIEANSSPGAGTEVLLTFPKRAAARGPRA